MHRELSPLIKLIYKLEAYGTLFFIWLCRLAGIKLASRFCGWLARMVGPLTSPHKTAKKNLKMVFPKKSDEEINKIAVGVWDNLGRILGEFPNIPKLSKKKLEEIVYVSEESKRNINKIKKSQKGHIIFSAHFGNWEMGHRTLAEHGLETKAVFRPLNNIYIDKIVNSLRGIEMIPKNKKGARQLLRELRSGSTVLMLIDQKMNDGIKVQFFGKPAMTAPAIANLALRFGIPLAPARVIRKDGTSKFEFEVGEPVEYKASRNVLKDELEVMKKINKQLESWIKEYPKQWFWVHHRWGK